MRTSTFLSSLLLSGSSILPTISAQPLSVFQFQAALTTAKNTISTLNRAIETNQNATATILQDLKAVNETLSNAATTIANAPGLVAGLSAEDQSKLEGIYTNYTTTPLQETAALLEKYKKVLPPAGEGAPYGFNVLGIISSLGKIEHSIAPGVPLDDVQIAGETTKTTAVFVPLAAVFFGRDHGF